MTLRKKGSLTLPAFENGTIWLAGAGPGAPGLLTLLCVKGLQEADVILYDALVQEDILNLSRPEALCRFVGKRAGVRSLKQPEITALMIEYARAGKRVLRLKGGDPFVFGRGGEEAMELARAGVHFRVIPGITAGIGGMAYAGIPATHRDINTVISFVTGHDSSGELPRNIDWEGLVSASPVIVFYMALKTMPEIISHLKTAGMAENTPVAVISNASIPGQRVTETTLAGYDLETASVPKKAPAIIVIGECVKIRGLIAGFQQTIYNPASPRALEC
ncbi:MAG: uroporphyrinogen-III C-methyltransferase [Alphaproteobacteria bacterium]|nr:uroporphyrinogen-III C-methyltransferase [Alphaproteobacteria bacterium]